MNERKPFLTRRKLIVGISALAALGGLISTASCLLSVSTRTPPIAEQAKAPEFSLPDQRGQTQSLNGLVAKGPALVVFYRGYW